MEDRAWLAKVTNTVTQHWQKKNERKRFSEKLESRNRPGETLPVPAASLPVGASTVRTPCELRVFSIHRRPKLATERVGCVASFGGGAPLLRLNRSGSTEFAVNRVTV